MKKYPKPLGPKSDTEAMAILFSMLGNAYNMLAQYEADERAEEYRRMDERITETNTLREKRREAARQAQEKMGDPAKSAAAHREDEQQ
jgi:hypothetical protein